MTKIQAKAEIFNMAFKSLSKKEKELVIEHFLNDPEFKEDLIDVAIIAQRKGEKARPFREYLSEKR
jgi:hypothetical protein